MSTEHAHTLQDWMSERELGLFGSHLARRHWATWRVPAGGSGEGDYFAASGDVRPGVLHTLRAAAALAFGDYFIKFVRMRRLVCASAAWCAGALLPRWHSPSSGLTDVTSTFPVPESV